MKAYMYAVIILVLAVILGCQDIFTYSPLDFLERDPSTLSKAQQLLYARQALSSGNDSAMVAALDVVENDLIPDDPTNPELWLLAGDLAWTLSHIPIALQNYLFANNNQFPDPGSPAGFPQFVTDVKSYLSDPGNEVPLLEAAAEVYYCYADITLGATLNAMQMLAAGLGKLSFQLSLPLPVPAEVLAAEAYINAAIRALIP